MRILVVKIPMSFFSYTFLDTVFWFLFLHTCISCSIKYVRQFGTNLKVFHEIFSSMCNVLHTIRFQWNSSHSKVSQSCSASEHSCAKTKWKKCLRIHTAVCPVSCLKRSIQVCIDHWVYIFWKWIICISVSFSWYILESFPYTLRKKVLQSTFFGASDCHK